MYPRLEIDANKLKHNAEHLLKSCQENGIRDCMLVTKVLAGYRPLVRRLASFGFSHLADSRIENLIRFQAVPIPKVLLRLPMPTEVSRVVRYADYSLQSEILTIKATEKAAARLGKTHGVILMFDVGDLREGLFFREDPGPLVQTVLDSPHLCLAGIGTNLTCYGGIVPDEENLGRLIFIKQQIESRFSLRIPLISGGNSSSVHLFRTGRLPKEVNSLRIGEAFFLGRETAFGHLLPGMNPDAFILKAEIIEVKVKPSYPIGNIGMNSFGAKPDIEDRGMMNRAILAIGRQDVEPGDLIPLDAGVRIVGASSDHLIVDLGNRTGKPGDVLAFGLNYPGLLRVMTSRYVKKRLK
ncbi:MAG TPA: alanine/ornithine racemase family PLP-dependent enzyme [Bacillota bacterium]|nr:alanine/ornithine racemase family PLP-dependent enzyme [Bacillota bacterium]